ncbi:MAG: adenosylcobinamide kinase/adenosylcobinamide phosphate guanyltransferase [marine bacterium B5-7]|nr:MAG: adenosylcobinamide kinase/adenosylcobinamide phosphate guanyltransferase [marine bacterium B5-7]
MTLQETSARHELILGGIKSGKSQFGASLAEASGLEVVFIATGTAGDEEMRQRIERHRAERPAHWLSVEEPLHLARELSRLASDDRCLLVDCLTLWLTNLLLDDDDTTLLKEVDALLDLLPILPGKIIMISNETSMGVVPATPLSRRFCDEAGLLHQQIARLCDRVILVTAGLPLILKGEISQ